MYSTSGPYHARISLNRLEFIWLKIKALKTWILLNGMEKHGNLSFRTLYGKLLEHLVSHLSTMCFDACWLEMELAKRSVKPFFQLLSLCTALCSIQQVKFFFIQKWLQ